MRRTKRVLKYVFYGVVTLALKPVGWVLSRTVSEYKNLWLVSERGFEARDNGYHFYRYLKEKHPEINARFVISKESADYGKIEPLKGVVEYRSFSHFLALASAEYLISTHIFPCAPDIVIYYHLAQIGIRPKGKRIFLQHGITKDNIEWYHGSHAPMELFCCGAMREYEYIREVYGHPAEVPQYLGFCRFDFLQKNAKVRNQITVMPTWRSSNYPKGKDFPQTAFYREWQGFLDDPRLHALLEKTGCELVFYPHIEMQGELEHFHSRCERIRFSDASRDDVQELLMNGKVLITDFSSVYFDAAYMNRPVLYFQFDEQEYRTLHYAEGYFDYERDGFGPVERNRNGLLSQLERLAEEDFKVSPSYQERIRRFFPVQDDCNCARTFEAIRKR